MSLSPSTTASSKQAGAALMRRASSSSSTTSASNANAASSVRLLLVRHGESEFNAAIRSPSWWLSPRFYANGFDPGIRDPQLTPKGRRQSVTNQEKLQQAIRDELRRSLTFDEGEQEDHAVGAAGNAKQHNSSEEINKAVKHDRAEEDEEAAQQLLPGAVEEVVDASAIAKNPNAAVQRGNSTSSSTGAASSRAPSTSSMQLAIFTSPFQRAIQTSLLMLGRADLDASKSPKTRSGAASSNTINAGSAEAEQHDKQRKKTSYIGGFFRALLPRTSTKSKIMPIGKVDSNTNSIAAHDHDHERTLTNSTMTGQNTIVALAALRERCKHISDLGTPLEELKQIYPGVNFDSNEGCSTSASTKNITTSKNDTTVVDQKSSRTATDNSWWLPKSKVGLVDASKWEPSLLRGTIEKKEEVRARIDEVKRFFLQQQNANLIIVFGHSNYFRAFMPNSRKLANAEIASCTLHKDGEVSDVKFL
ncbi:unnamed protein product [Amoebophrya sp. A120]|nr:unnamed protein product [Amoebophrya sp. A120]|eukprot:GSA120T00013620001.1